MPVLCAPIAMDAIPFALPNLRTSSGGEENAKVSNSVVLGETQQSQTDDDKHGVREDEWTTDAVFVAQDCASKHPDSSGNVGRCDQTLRHCNVETHAFVENDGKEVCNSVSVGRCQAWKQKCTRQRMVFRECILAQSYGTWLRSPRLSNRRHSAGTRQCGMALRWRRDDPSQCEQQRRRPPSRSGRRWRKNCSCSRLSRGSRRS